MPTFGVYKALDAFRRCAIFGGSPLQKAKKAGALFELKIWKFQQSLGGLVQGVQLKWTRDEHNLARIKMDLEFRERWVATKLSWLTGREVQLNKILPSVANKGTRLEERVIRALDQLLPGPKTGPLVVLCCDLFQYSVKSETQ